MPTVQAIQIKLSLQTSGEDAIKRFAQQIQSLAKIPIKIDLDSTLNAGAESITKIIQTTEELLTKSLDKIPKLVATGIEQVFDSLSQKLETGIFDADASTEEIQKIGDEVENQGKKIVQTAEDVEETILTRTVAGVGLFAATFDVVWRAIKDNAQDAGELFGTILADIQQRGIDTYSKIFSSAQEFAGSIQRLIELKEPMWNLFQLFQAGRMSLEKVTEVLPLLGNAMYGLVTSSGMIAINLWAVKEATAFIRKTIFGIFTGVVTHQPVPMLERVQKVINTVDQSLYSVGLTFGHVFKTVGSGLLAFLPSFFGVINPFNTIIMKLAFFNSLTSALSAKFIRGRLAASAFFGNGMSKIQLAFLNIRDFIFLLSDKMPKILDSFKNVIDYIPSLTKSWATNQDNIAKKREADILAQKKQLAEQAKKQKVAEQQAPPLPRINDWSREYYLSQIKAKTQELARTITAQKALSIAVPLEIQPILSKTHQFILQKIAAIQQAAVGKEFLSKISVPLTLPAPKQPLLLPDLRDRQTQTRDHIKELMAKGVRQNDIAKSVQYDVGTFGQALRGKRDFTPEIMARILALTQEEIPKYISNGLSVGIAKINELLSKGIKPATIAKSLGMAPTVLANLRNQNARITEDMQKAILALDPAKLLASQKSKTNAAGKKIADELANGIQSGATLLKKVMDTTLQNSVDSQLPHSPAKEGPLRTLRESGKSIFSELAIGMNNGAAVAKAAVVKVTTAIARFFPHSPAEEGPLRGLRQWGQGILSQLSLGITDKIQSVLNLFFNLANQIKATLKPVLEMSFMGERMGINTQTVSLLEYAFAGFEVQASEVQMTMNGLNRTLAEVATPEKLAALAQVGINLQQVRSAANPTLELFYQLSDSLQRFPMSSDKMIKAMEALGVSTQSNLINALAQGRTQIQAAMNEGVTMGAAYEESFVKAGHSFTELMNKIEKIGGILEREFATTLMPVVDNLARKMFNFYKENSTNIRAIVRIAGESIGILVEMISSAVNLAWQNPTALKNAFLEILTWLWQTAGTIWDTFLEDAIDGMTSHIWLFVKHTVWGVLNAGWNMFKQLVITAFNKFILYLISKIKETVALLANILSAIGLDFSDDIASLLDPLDKLAEDASQSTKFSLEETLWKAADENAKIMAEARKASADEFQKIQDPEVMRRTVERFEQSWREISDRFSGALQGTGFDKILADNIERLKTALSPENFTGTKEELEAIDQQMQALNEGLVSVGKNAENAGQKVGDAAGKVVDGLKNGIKTAEQEIKALGDKILGMQLDLQIRVAQNDDERRDAQRKKDLLDLQSKHSQELIEYQKLLQAQLLQDQNYAKMSYDKQIEFIKGLDEYKQFVANQETERKIKEAKQPEEKSGGFFDKKQEEMLQTWQNTFNTLGTAFGNMYEMMGEKAVAFFYLQKGVAIADATISGAMATLNAYEKGMQMGGPTVAAIFAAIAAAASVTQIGVITAQAIQGPTAMATGGFVPGTGNQDNVPINATPGEFVIPKGSTKSLIDQYGVQIMEGLRRGYISLDSQLPKPPNNQTLSFATGGTVPTLNVQQTSQQQQQAINVINVVDPNEIDQYIASARGQTMILNVIQKHRNQIQRYLK